MPRKRDEMLVPESSSFLSPRMFHSFFFTTHRLEGVLLLADVKDLEGLLGSLETAQSHGTESRA